jgi:hypothetical protein
MIEIRYTDYDIAKAYAGKIRECETAAQLTAILKQDYPFLIDAIDQAGSITDADWCWAKQNAKKKECAEKVVKCAGKIFMPEILLHMSYLAGKFKVPEGCALKRILETRP